MEGIYGYGTALGVKQSNCPLGVYAHGCVCEVDPESDQGQPAPAHQQHQNGLNQDCGRVAPVKI